MRSFPFFVMKSSIGSARIFSITGPAASVPVAAIAFR